MIETKRLIIQAPTLQVLDTWLALYQDPLVTRYIGGPRDKALILSWLNRDLTHYKKHHFSMGSLFEKQSNQFIGRAGLVHFNYEEDETSLEIGFALHKLYWRKGYATEIIRALVKYGFDKLNAPQIIAQTHSQNIASQRALESNGMDFIKKLQHQSDTFNLYAIKK